MNFFFGFFVLKQLKKCSQLFSGRTLLFNSSLILLLVHRYTVTKLRELGFSFLLPLDHNIYIHKFIGVLIFVQSWFHTIMHICNFCKLRIIDSEINTMLIFVHIVDLNVVCRLCLLNLTLLLTCLYLKLLVLIFP